MERGTKNSPLHFLFRHIGKALNALVCVHTLSHTVPPALSDAFTIVRRGRLVQSGFGAGLGKQGGQQAKHHRGGDPGGTGGESAGENAKEAIFRHSLFDPLGQ